MLALRHDLATRAAALSFVSNLTLMALKLAVGLLTGSIAVLSDGIDSAQDAIASLFVFASVRFAQRPADAGHPYGHGKAESLAAAAQGLLIAGGGGYIVFAAVRRLLERDVEIETTPGLIALGATAVVNVGVALYVGRAARRTGSVALGADARHLWTNVAQALAVVAALALVATTGHTVFDPAFALALAAYLFWTAGNVFASALREIMDVRLPEGEEALIEACLRACAGVRGFHDLRTRKSGRERYVDVHVLVDPARTVGEAHALVDEIEQAITSRLPGAVVNVHLDPEG